MQDVFRKGQIEIKGKNGYYSYSEKIRALGAFELLDLMTKIKWGEALITRIRKDEGREADFWALGRIGARHPVYGTLPHIVPKDVCMRWVRTLLDCPFISLDTLLPLAEQLGRLTSHREINLDRALIDELLTKFADHAQYQRIKELLTTVVPLTRAEQEYVLGDLLPAGLTLEMPGHSL